MAILFACWPRRRQQDRSEPRIMTVPLTREWLQALDQLHAGDPPTTLAQRVTKALLPTEQLDDKEQQQRPRETLASTLMPGTKLLSYRIPTAASVKASRDAKSAPGAPQSGGCASKPVGEQRTISQEFSTSEVSAHDHTGSPSLHRPASPPTTQQRARLAAAVYARHTSAASEGNREDDRHQQRSVSTPKGSHTQQRNSRESRENGQQDGYRYMWSDVPGRVRQQETLETAPLDQRVLHLV